MAALHRAGGAGGSATAGSGAARSPLALAGFLLAVLMVAGALLAAYGNRRGWWDYRMALMLLRYAVYGGAGAAVISLAGLVHALYGARRGAGWAVVGLLAGLLLIAVPLWAVRQASGLPKIHDITTDTDAPPPFVAVLALRKNAPNPAEYGGPALAAQQKRGYPDLAPQRIDRPPAAVFAAVRQTAQGMGWRIVAAEPAEGRLEATARTFWMGFQDDIVVRVKPEGAGTRVDLRSVSRVGGSDLGANARRIRAFQAKLREALGL
ncbi:MAG: DUF1499 domain-containing protein [Candidatus Lambdaproteobacteria bacterium]|nr:DUF1499 domain-containing protein [Candidatus Lambdaproteobacteria bacterium]